MGKTLNELFRDLICLNELDGNISAALRFSNASSSSGLSFGLSQLDVTHNDSAVQCLKECGFSNEEIKELQTKSVDWKLFNPRLESHADIIERYDEAQLSHCLDSSLNFALSHGIAISNTSAILASADYINQYGSEGQGMLDYLHNLNRPFTPEDILYFKLHNTKYGRENPEDCQRRYNNLMKIVKEEI
jgi:hypothetical protein